MKTEQLSAAQQAEQLAASRRSFFEDTLKVLGAGAVAAVALEAQNAPNPQMGDIAVLNYALTLEHLEAAFYNQGLRQYSSTDFRNGSFFTGFGEEAGSGVYAYLILVRDHENAHVRTLESVIRSLGGTPVKPCTYDFGYSNFEDFLKTAAVLENTGVMAYDGAIAQISSPALKTAAATIAMVEARHASYLNLVTGQVPFPAATDTPKTMQEILAAAGPFIKSCPDRAIR